MVLLAPSVSALRALLGVCEKFAVSHGLQYNTKKSQFMVFKAGSRCTSVVPPIKLYNEPLKRVYSFKYLGYILTDSLKDDEDIERERRALSVRANMLVHRFGRCTDAVKITLFKAYCTALLRLPRYCSASAMFALAGVDSFDAIIRKKTASLLNRVRGSGHSVLSEIADSGDCPLIKQMIARTMSCLIIKY
ncbi:unnamed protein product [Parnassius mnemosyne]